MLSSLGRHAIDFAARYRPWSEVYGLARTLLALGTASTLAFSSSAALFRPVVGLADYPIDQGLSRFSWFAILGRDQLDLARLIAIVLLLVVASGWRPRITGPLHWWLTFSFQSSATMLDGGDQVSCVLTLILLPATLADPRRWHWQRLETPMSSTAGAVGAVVAASSLLVARIQMAGIYFHASVAKFDVEEWVDGTALYYWLLDPGFGAPFWQRPILEPLLVHPVSVAVLTWSVLVFEAVLFAGLFMKHRWRKPLLFVALGFHAGIAVVHGLISFALAMSAGLVLYLWPKEQEIPLISAARAALTRGIRWRPRTAAGKEVEHTVYS